MQAPRLPPTTCHLEGRLARAARRQHKLRRLVADNSLAAAPDDAATSARAPGIEFPKNCGPPTTLKEPRSAWSRFKERHSLALRF